MNGTTRLPSKNKVTGGGGVLLDSSVWIIALAVRRRHLV